eukprot:IDg20836t1
MQPLSDEVRELRSKCTTERDLRKVLIRRRRGLHTHPAKRLARTRRARLECGIRLIQRQQSKQCIRGERNGRPAPVPARQHARKRAPYCGAYTNTRDRNADLECCAAA